MPNQTVVSAFGKSANISNNQIKALAAVGLAIGMLAMGTAGIAVWQASSSVHAQSEFFRWLFLSLGHPSAGGAFAASVPGALDIRIHDVVSFLKSRKVTPQTLKHDGIVLSENDRAAVKVLYELVDGF